ncbi:hypothetical protein A2422_02840 [Candidatus Woesebacteria bacterium RIFOXYC1_FULL_31_51]|uniref:Hydrolase, NUDIX family domain protein n=1 Tax=Candidatus Woesebacteria bacterium GW2011_GWC2_31_9 TaxID=1618586 RepID=A0A0F9YH60_9BACT|nr:MAG: NUDIX family hydrolase [Candidatus Woesebacteria bacterium GW2011_GWF1_31_35]KKP23430.1 MAG: Hydrolase, NUDIX family domain protein [Candidatus Woesebacteria bacterium GW2011_GWC1_30_29]KKP26407.1 MAG: Hydrolase, NUDIX family domain protein [Candidatus Woesebacteria bacterium GW2011_GWD1_31_12]KKP27706.1 MAG: Hydrolase, NUDIX family domain protein [Candidatus Woesebacteria bacterium GW2011_GWB1_31_29]KKP30924.1 MAG: Hydrolase, NUDIX family domain protein [Candidatus Woesebacteria bacter
MAWKVKSSKEVYKNPYMTVTEDEVTTDNGLNLTWGVVHKSEAVGIIPFDGEYFYLVGQYRYPINLYSWEFPQGHFENHKSIKEAAIHELEEEAGLISENIIEIGRFFLAPGHNTQEYHVYLATNLKVVGQKPDPDEEGMKVKKVNITEIKNMIKNSEIKDGPTITIFKLFELYLEKNNK